MRKPIAKPFLNIRYCLNQGHMIWGLLMMLFLFNILFKLMVLHLILHLNSWQYVDKQMDCSDQISNVCCSKVWYEVIRMIQVKNTDGACCVVFFRFIPKTSNPAHFLWLWMLTMNVRQSQQQKQTTHLWCQIVSGSGKECLMCRPGKELLCCRLRKTGEKQ